MYMFAWNMYAMHMTVCLLKNITSHRSALLTHLIRGAYSQTPTILVMLYEYFLNYILLSCCCCCCCCIFFKPIDSRIVCHVRYTYSHTYVCIDVHMYVAVYVCCHYVPLIPQKKNERKKE